MERLQGKVAIVTGASRGIGAGIARMFTAEGAKVTLAARTEDRMQALADEIARDGGEVAVAVTDVSRSEDLRRMVEITVERFGGLDILV
ncbi:MAG: SDR family NAD(P)-dependent oxidoreductase, partial [Armatimonadetes bacterium]|nr:SDR family NAD(P)-dependent oxidoreductase [Armatimonadota bacterium]